MLPTIKIKNRMTKKEKEEKAIEIADNIKIAIGIDVFAKNRKQPIVDARSMYTYILRKDLNFTLYEIRDLFKSQGKSFDHSTAHHNVVLFENEVRYRRPDLDSIREQILGILSPRYVMMQKINKLTDENKIEKIILILKTWESQSI